jgi:hypothetical protein
MRHLPNLLKPALFLQLFIPQIFFAWSIWLARELLLSALRRCQRPCILSGEAVDLACFQASWLVWHQYRELGRKNRPEACISFMTGPIWGEGRRSHESQVSCDLQLI